MAAREITISLNGRPVRYLEAGAGEPLLLVHAFPLSADLWRPQLDSPPDGWRLIAPDVRGFRGPSAAAPPPPGDASMDGYARDIVDLLDHLGIERAVVGGLSMGGYIMFALWRLAPQYVRALVLADTRSEADTPEGRDRRRDMLALIDREGAAGVADAMLPNLLGQDTHRSRPDLLAHVRTLIEANPPGAIAAAMSAMMARPDSTPQLGRMRCPTLVACGEQDALTPPACSEALHDAIPESRLALIPGAGHLSSLEQPDAFNAVLGRFLQERLA